MSKISYSFRGCVAVSETAGYLTTISFAIYISQYIYLDIEDMRNTINLILYL
jgi:hypothetical protein